MYITSLADDMSSMKLLEALSTRRTIVKDWIIESTRSEQRLVVRLQPVVIRRHDMPLLRESQTFCAL